MKSFKIILAVITIFIIMNSNLFAQDKCVKKGDILIDAFYGYPFFYTGLLRDAYITRGGNSVHSNQFGGGFEKMLTDKIGVGLEGTYAKATIKYGGSGNSQYIAGITKYRILGKVNFYFATSRKLDTYLTVGAGYMNLNNYQTQAGINNLSSNEFIQGNLPIAIRVGIGLSYFFSKFVGINAEAGIGGPILRGGLSFKF